LTKLKIGKERGGKKEGGEKEQEVRSCWQISVADTGAEHRLSRPFFAHLREKKKRKKRGKRKRREEKRGKRKEVAGMKTLKCFSRAFYLSAGKKKKKKRGRKKRGSGGEPGQRADCSRLGERSGKVLVDGHSREKEKKKKI